MGSKRKHYKHCLQLEKKPFGVKNKSFDRLFGKGLKEREIKFWYTLHFIFKSV